MLFVTVYANTAGPVAYLYMVETTIDTALGLCMLSLWGTSFILALIVPVLLGDSDTDGAMGVSNVFFMFAGLSLLGAIFAFFLMPETQGLTDKEKK